MEEWKHWDLTCNLKPVEKKPAPPMDPAGFDWTRLGFTPDEQQLAVLQSDAKRGILNCSRQWGKSTVAAAKAVERAYTRAGSLVLVSSPSGAAVGGVSAQGGGDGYAAEDPGSAGMGITRSLCCFRTGRGLWGCRGMRLPCAGFSKPSLILIDEASRVEDQLYKSLRPCWRSGTGICG